MKSLPKKKQIAKIWMDFQAAGGDVPWQFVSSLDGLMDGYLDGWLDG